MRYVYYKKELTSRVFDVLPAKKQKLNSSLSDGRSVDLVTNAIHHSRWLDSHPYIYTYTRVTTPVYSYFQISISFFLCHHWYKIFRTLLNSTHFLCYRKKNWNHLLRHSIRILDSTICISGLFEEYFNILREFDISIICNFISTFTFIIPLSLSPFQFHFHHFTSTFTISFPLSVIVL